MAKQTCSEGIPYLHPIAVLLFKAKYARGKDEFDINAALPKLKRLDRYRLKVQLEYLYGDHRWIKLLS